MTDQNPQTRIPKSIGTETKLFGRYTLTDVAVGLAPAVAIAMLVQLVVPPGLTVAGITVRTALLPLLLVGVASGATIVLLTPSYTSCLTWLGAVAGYLRGARRRGPPDARLVAEIAQVHPRHGAVERADGAFLGMVQVQPMSMPLATEADWARQASVFGDMLNTTVDFPVQLYSTTRAVSTEQHLAPYRKQLTTLDAEVDEIRYNLTESYIDWHDTDLQRRGSTRRDHYVVVAVTPSEVRIEEESPLGPISSLPLVGSLLQALASEPPALERERLADELDLRLRRIEAGIRGLEGCSARRLDALDSTAVIARYWRGDAADETDLESAVRSTPIVGGETA